MIDSSATNLDRVHVILDLGSLPDCAQTSVSPELAQKAGTGLPIHEKAC